MQELTPEVGQLSYEVQGLCQEQAAWEAVSLSGGWKVSMQHLESSRVVRLQLQGSPEVHARSLVVAALALQRGNRAQRPHIARINLRATPSRHPDCQEHSRSTLQEVHRSKHARRRASLVTLQQWMLSLAFRFYVLRTCSARAYRFLAACADTRARLSASGQNVAVGPEQNDGAGFSRGKHKALSGSSDTRHQERQVVTCTCTAPALRSASAQAAMAGTWRGLSASARMKSSRAAPWSPAFACATAHSCKSHTSQAVCIISYASQKSHP